MIKRINTDELTTYYKVYMDMQLAMDVKGWLVDDKCNYTQIHERFANIHDDGNIPMDSFMSPKFTNSTISRVHGSIITNVARMCLGEDMTSEWMVQDIK
jgi:hypothetical protein